MDDIQVAHDCLWLVVHHENVNPFDPDALEALGTCLATLCWVLGHAGGVTVGRNLATIRDHWALNGLILADGSLPEQPKPPPLTPEVAELLERQRRERIAAGVEPACSECGCSETKRCASRCTWATTGPPPICTRCFAQHQRVHDLEDRCPSENQPIQ